MAAIAPSSTALVLVTAASEQQATSIARTLVDEGLAACVNVVGPVRSVYRWREAVEEESEYILLIKTRARLYTKLEHRVKELHSYEVPEVLAFSPTAGSKPYLQWLWESTAPAAARRSTPR